MTKLQRAILDFETQWWRRLGNKDTAIRETFGFEPPRYYEKLDLLLDDPEAILQAPATMARYRHFRELRQRRVTGTPR